MWDVAADYSWKFQTSWIFVSNLRIVVGVKKGGEEMEKKGRFIMEYGGQNSFEGKTWEPARAHTLLRRVVEN